MLVEYHGKVEVSKHAADMVTVEAQLLSQTVTVVVTVTAEGCWGRPWTKEALVKYQYISQNLVN